MSDERGVMPPTSRTWDDGSGSVGSAEDYGQDWRTSQIRCCLVICPQRTNSCMDCQRITDTHAETRVERCRCKAEVVVQDERIGLHFSPKDDELLCPLSGTLTDEGWRRLLTEIKDDAVS